MRTYVFYRSNTEDEKDLRDFLHNLKLEGEEDSVKLKDINTRDGDADAKLYGVDRYPTVVTVANDGQMIRTWDGTLPLVRELTFYLRQH